MKTSNHQARAGFHGAGFGVLVQRPTEFPIDEHFVVLSLRTPGAKARSRFASLNRFHESMSTEMQSQIEREWGRRRVFMTEITLRIDGMHCGSCIRRVTQAISSAGAFQVEEVRLGAARFQAPDPSEANAAIAALAKAGFQARIDE